MKDMDGRDLMVLLLTFILPPLGVALKVGFGVHFWINLALTVFGMYLPGLVHGLYVFFKRDS